MNKEFIYKVIKISIFSHILIGNSRLWNPSKTLFYFFKNLFLIFFKIGEVRDKKAQIQFFKIVKKHP
ncbi:hypothetical protein C6497_17525 [Candidatus Poribacteria bacterium]|nr:MAG: hypothetical protein C6497_17525 [Candidatus Poribacteria bacterium]